MLLAKNRFDIALKNSHMVSYFPALPQKLLLMAPLFTQVRLIGLKSLHGREATLSILLFRYVDEPSYSSISFLWAALNAPLFLACRNSL